MPRSHHGKLERFYRLERVAGRIFLALLCVCATSVLVELVYRSLVRNSPFWVPLVEVNRAGIAQKPYVMFAAKPSREWPDVNRLGYRGPLPESPKSTGETRIFVIGGSAVFLGEPAFPAILEELLHKRGLGGARVYNFGIPASVSRQELVRILVDIAALEPDLILSYSGYNDTFDTGWDPRINYPHRYLLFEANPAVAKVSDFKWLPTLALGSQLARDYLGRQIFRSLSRGILPGDFPQRETFRQLIVRAYMQNLRLSRVVSESLGARFLAFFQPTIYWKKSLEGREKAYPQGDQRGVSRRVRQLLEQELARHPGELEFQDLSDLFADEGREVFYDFCHFSSEWPSVRVAETLVPYVERALKRGKPKAAITGLTPETAFMIQ